METLSVIRANKSKEFSKLQGISSETKRVESVITKAKKLTEYEMAKNPLTAFDYALKSPESKRQCPKRLKVFFDFLKIDSDLVTQTIAFVSRAKNDSKWAQDNLMRFIMFQIERAHGGEIAEATINNYYKATKLLCEMNDIQLSWKKISRGIPKGRQAANVLKYFQTFISDPLMKEQFSSHRKTLKLCNT